MATTKLTITLPDEQLAEVRALVGAGQTASVSGFVQHAVGVALHDAAGWREMLADALRETGGPLTDKERAWADSVLTPGDKKPRRKLAFSTDRIRWQNGCERVFEIGEAERFRHIGPAGMGGRDACLAGFRLAGQIHFLNSTGSVSCGDYPLRFRQ